MKKSLNAFLSMCVGLSFIMTSCNDETEFAPKEETGLFKINLSLPSVSSRADAVEPSTAVPSTSWDNVKQLHLMLYDLSGYIRWTKIMKAEEFADSINEGVFSGLFANVPTGTFRFVAYANGGEDGNVTTAVANSAGGFNEMAFTEHSLINVHQDSIRFLPKATTAQKFPDYYQSRLDHDVEAGLRAIEVGRVTPGDIFRGGTDAFTIAKITVKEGEPIVLPTIRCTLRRDVSILRIRINPEIFGTDNLVDLTKNCGIYIANIPEAMRIPQDSPGSTTGSPVVATSQRNAVYVVYDENGTFKTADPTVEDGYDEGGKIIDEKYTMWRDVIVFPNDHRAANGNAANRYILTLTAQGLRGHVLFDESVMQEDGPVYWTAYINTPIEANKIYDINIDVASGGTYPTPPSPDVPTGENLPHLKISNIKFHDWFSPVVEDTIRL